MSLINHVLRELDRRAAAGAAAVLPPTVHAAAAPAVSPQRRRPAVLALGALCVAGAVWVQGPSKGARPLPMATAQATAATAANPAPQPMAVAEPAVVAVMAPSPNAAAPLPEVAAIDAAPKVQPTSAASPSPPTTARPAPVPASAPATARALPRSTLAWAPMAAPADIAAPTSPPPEADADAAAPPLPGNARIDKRTRASKPQERADAAYRLGLAAHERGDYAEAARSYAAALQDSAALVPARVGLASVLIAQNRLGEAEALLQAGLALDPQQPLLVQPLSRLLADRGDLAAAIGWMQSGLPGGMAQADYRACLAALLQRAGQQREAAEHFNAALRLQPGNGVWWMGLALALSAQGHGEAARIAYTRARNAGTLSAELAHFVELRLQDPL